MKTLRLPYFNLCPELTDKLRSVGTTLENSRLGIGFIELLYLRVSQINQCEFCLKLHSKKLLETGETHHRLEELANWRISTLFDEREKAALNWAESLTNIKETHAPESDFTPLTKYFSDVEITEITFAIVSMNALNRLAIGMRRIT
jgi:AhpD family alkylhydroperoxidase